MSQIAFQMGLAEQLPPLPTPPCANEAPDGETAEDVIRPRHVRTNAPRKLDFEALPREHLRHELLAQERVCKLTGKPLVEVGEVTNEELNYRPAKLVVVVHHRVTYGLAEADRREFTIEPIVTPQPPRAIEDARVGAGLLAQILVQKYTHHLPLYRQQAIFERAGLKIPRQTTCDWVLAGAFNLAPIQHSIRSGIVKGNVVLLDDTPIKCQGSRGGTIFQTHLWTYSSPCADGVVFDFAADRGHAHVLDFLGPDFTGYLVGDGYAGYGTIASKRPGVIEAGCWAHGLRKFRDARGEAPAEAASMMSAIARLFDIERDADSAGLDAQARHALRQERSKPALAYIESLAKVQRTAMSEASDYLGALKYITNQ